jgi:hypothetical protein
MAIKIISLNKLPNAFHFETVMKTLERIGATSVAQENVGVRPLFEDLMTKFQREDAAYKQSLKSFKTEDIKHLDDERDAYADCIRRVAEEWAKLPDAARSAAGRLVAQVYKDFQFRATEARIAETAKLLNMFQVFDDEAHTAALETMGLTPLVAALRGLNTQLRELMSDRSTEQAEYLVGELRAARLEVDEAYAKLIAYLNALLLISPSEELTQLEKVLNQDIKLLEAQLAAGKKKSASGSSGSNGNSGNNGDGGTTVISNEDTIQGLE